ncbi:MAG: crotonase/enoyl-CoA hydratase family protein [Limnobacter sp.]|nr:crotonase/enoyl-CoA hydratase family protein [Limnobacter sp.]
MSTSSSQAHSETVTLDTHFDQRVWVVSINRPEVRNCVDRITADELLARMEQFENDPTAQVAILTGKGGHFCAGADLKAVKSQDPARANRIAREGAAPMGLSRFTTSKPTIAAVSGHAVAGGLELACWADLRVAEADAVFGVFCRRFGVPLIDGGTVRLPRLIGQSRAMDMILTGRPVKAEEALEWGLVNRITATGQTSLEGALALAEQLLAFPQTCMRNDRLSALAQWGMTETRAMQEEFEFGLNTLHSGETAAGAELFSSGKGRHGSFES